MAQDQNIEKATPSITISVSVPFRSGKIYPFLKVCFTSWRVRGARYADKSDIGESIEP